MRIYRTTGVISFILPVISGIFSIIAADMTISVVIYLLFGMVITSVLITVIPLIAGGLISGYICGKLRRRYGLIGGFICGCTLAAILTASACLITGDLPDLCKPVLLIVSGCIGGIYGVN